MSWFDLVPNIGKENEDDPDITDTGIFSEVLPAVGQLFNFLRPYRRETPLVRNSHEEEASGNSQESKVEELPPKTDEAVTQNVETSTSNTGDEVGLPGTSQSCNNKEELLMAKNDEVLQDKTESSASNAEIPATQASNGINEDDESSSDDDISTSSESSSSSESEVEDINLTCGFSKLDLDVVLKSMSQRVNLRKLFKPDEYESLTRFEQKRIIRIENKLTLMLRLKLPLPNENIIREKVGLPRRDIELSDSSDTESDDGWESRCKSTSSGPVFRGISDEDTAARMAFITKYCEDRQSGKRVVQELPKKIIAKPAKIRRIAEKKEARFETFKKASKPQDGSGDGPSNDDRACYNTRKNSNVKYEEDYVPENDHFVYCEDCMKVYIDDCPDHPLTIMKDSVAEVGVENYAKRTCPPGLSIDPSSVRNAGYGAWADVAISKNTVFGPYKGEIIKKYDTKKLTKVCNGGYSWEIYQNGKLLHYVDGSDPTISNWMRYVNCSRFEEEQNLVAFQYCGQIYYRAFSDIKPDTEMFVWYGTHYASQLGIQEKLKSKHPQPENHYLCPDTGQVNQVSACIQKSRSHTSELSKSLSDNLQAQFPSKSCWTCSTCNEEFAFELNLLHHVDYVHKGIKHFRCRACHKTSGGYFHLKNHTRIHTGEKPFKCDICGDRFNQASYVRTHKRIHTGEKPFKCDICGDRFNQAGNLRKHERIHTGEKPFKCDVCGDRFNRTSVLRRHKRIHTGEKPYKCDVCGVRFTQLSNMRNHERRHYR